ncbi:MAG: accessory gene regulator ArgB-like protein [Bacillota bacterium]
METLARKITHFIKFNNLNLTDLEIKKIEFGLTCMIGELSKVLMYLIIFSMFQVIEYFLVGLVFFCILRLVAGGFHENTYWRCFFTSLLIFTIIVVTSSNVTLSMTQKIFVVFMSLLLICRYAPVDHPNKPIISEVRRKRFKLLSIFMCLFLGTISLLLKDALSVAAVTAIFLEALTLPLGEIIKRSHKYESIEG